MFRPQFFCSFVFTLEHASAEMVQTATELRGKMLKLKTRQVERKEQARAERVYNSLTDYLTVNQEKGKVFCFSTPAH